MPFRKMQVGGSWTVVDEANVPHGSGLTEIEADRMVEASYANTDQVLGRRPKGKSGPPESLNVPFTYEG